MQLVFFIIQSTTQATGVIAMQRAGPVSRPPTLCPPPAFFGPWLGDLQLLLLLFSIMLQAQHDPSKASWGHVFLKERLG